MGTISVTLPTVGSANSTEDPLVRTALSTLVTAFNGNIDTNNLNAAAGIIGTQLAAAANIAGTQLAAAAAIADTQLASPNNALRRLVRDAPTVIAAATGAGDYTMSSPSPQISGTQAGNSVPIINVAELAAFTVTGKTQKGRVRASIFANGTAPATTVTFGLYPVSTVGGAGGVAISLGTVVTGSTVAMVSPSSGQGTTGESAEFTMPSASNFYVLGFNLAGGTAAGSFVQAEASLYSYFS